MTHMYAIDSGRPMIGMSVRIRETMVKSPIIATREREESRLASVMSVIRRTSWELLPLKLRQHSAGGGT